MGTPTYWPIDLDKIPDMLDFYITSGISPSYVIIASSYDLSSDHTPVIATVSTEPINKMKTTPRLDNRTISGDDYRIITEEAVNLSICLKSPEELDIALTNYFSILKEAAQQAIPTPKPQTRSINIPYEIKKKLIADKRRAGKVWQQKHAAFEIASLYSVIQCCMAEHTILLGK
jgi:hypothetical protein